MNIVSADRNPVIVTPARSSTVVDKPRLSGRRQRIDDAEREQRAGEARQRDGRQAGEREIEVERDREHRAERRAARDAERVRRRERVAEQRLEDDAPAAASDAPTSAAASTRGSRAMKKICASRLSANGIERSNTRASEMCVDPTTGATTSATSSSALKAATVVTSLVRMGCTGQVRPMGTTVRRPVRACRATSASTL